MRRKWLSLAFLGFSPWLLCGEAVLHAEQPCAALLKGMKLPAKLKTRGKPRRARWEQVDKVLSGMTEELQETACEFKFEELFTTDRKELYLPVTNSVVRVVPEGALKGLSIFDQSGEHIGQYESRIAYDRSGSLYARSSYTLYYFQFQDQQGNLQSTGNRLLLDSFLVRWKDVKGRVALTDSGGSSK